jgi:hypothetical protein
VRRALVPVACALLLTAPASRGSADLTEPSPALYRVLVTSAIPDARLTHRFYSARIAGVTPSRRARRHHAAGAVEITLDGGEDTIRYVLFPNRGAALGYWRDANPARRAGVESRLPARGFPAPAVVVNGSTARLDPSHRRRTSGLSDLAFVAGSVVVEAITRSTVSSRSGDIPSTYVLGKLALRQLRDGEARVRQR